MMILLLFLSKIHFAYILYILQSVIFRYSTVELVILSSLVFESIVATHSEFCFSATPLQLSCDFFVNEERRIFKKLSINSFIYSRCVVLNLVRYSSIFDYGLSILAQKCYIAIIYVRYLSCSEELYGMINPTFG